MTQKLAHLRQKQNSTHTPINKADFTLLIFQDLQNSEPMKLGITSLSVLYLPIFGLSIDERWVLLDYTVSHEPLRNWVQPVEGIFYYIIQYDQIEFRVKRQHYDSRFLSTSWSWIFRPTTRYEFCCAWWNTCTFDIPEKQHVLHREQLARKNNS